MCDQGFRYGADSDRSDLPSKKLNVHIDTQDNNMSILEHNELLRKQIIDKQPQVIEGYNINNILTHANEDDLDALTTFDALVTFTNGLISMGVLK